MPDANYSKNLQTGKIIMAIANSAAALFFFVAFVLTRNFWFLAASLALVVVTVIAVFYFGAIERKYNRIIEGDVGTGQKKKPGA